MIKLIIYVCRSTLKQHSKNMLPSVNVVKEKKLQLELDTTMVVIYKDIVN